LDSDNFTGPRFATYINAEFEHGTELCFSSLPDGTHGRIAVTREKFMAAGGYDESFDWYGWDDNDLKERISRTAIKRAVVIPRCLCRTLPEETGRLEKVKAHEDTNTYNETLSNVNVSAGKLIANKDKAWGSILARKNFRDIVET